MDNITINYLGSGRITGYILGEMLNMRPLQRLQPEAIIGYFTVQTTMHEELGKMNAYINGEGSMRTVLSRFDFFPADFIF